MNRMLTLESCDDWKHCITALCGIPLIKPYIEQRLTALRDLAEYSTRKFVATWSEQHRLRVIGWFEPAQQEKCQTNGSTRSGQTS